MAPKAPRWLREKRFTRENYAEQFPVRSSSIARKKPDWRPVSSITSPSTISRTLEFERLVETYLSHAPRGYTR